MMELWPFTNFHDLNLDWIIKVIKEWNKRLDEFFNNNGIHDYIEGILQEHPEWVTTVMDGSISESKFVPRFLQSVLNPFVTPQMFGAVADGMTDDYQAIQDAIDYAAAHNNYVFFPAGTYLTSDVLKVPYHRNNPGYWYVNGVRLIGANMADTIIKRSTSSAYYNNVDTVLYCYCEDPDNNMDDTGTGVEIAHLTIDNSLAGLGSYCIFGNYSRSHIHDLNLKGQQGIKTEGFTNTFENIWFAVNEHAIHAGNTSSIFRKLYATHCNDAYHIDGNYCKIDLIFGDNCTGTLLETGSAGTMEIGSIGAESPDLDNVVKIIRPVSYAENCEVSINSIFSFNLTTENANIVNIERGKVTINNINIMYNRPLANNYNIIHFANKYGRVVLGNISYLSNVTTYDASKVTEIDNAISGNIVARITASRNDITRYDGTHWIGVCDDADLYSPDSDMAEARGLMMNITRDTAVYRSPDGTDLTYRRAPKNGGAVILNYGAGKFGVGSAHPMKDDDANATFQNTIYGHTLLTRIAYGPPPASITNFTPKEGVMWLDYNGHKLYIYLGNTWKEFTTS